ncbi:DUF3429 domain-containing protein [Tropicibacter sp. S64]|uniref:DUF3429 domain-containing protein n=1 Tax=Tropicibacter sp. S64 TaxID=3415122 RepID=UPI003C7DD82A
MTKDQTIPRAALLLGLAGVIPFAWGALTVLSAPLAEVSARTLGGRFTGPYIQLFYGAIILAFMSGVLWGFASKTTGGQAATGYALSTLPALWAFFFTGGGPVSAAVYLIGGYAGLLMLDWQFWRWGLAPPWWMRLRLLLSGLVILCLLVTVLT